MPFDDDGPDEGFHARFTLEGEIDLKLASGEVASLTKAIARFAGTFGMPDAPFRLILEGKMGELRKIGVVLAPLGDLMRVAAAEPDNADGTVTFRADAEKLERLQMAAVGTPDMDAEALMQNQRYMTEIFTFDGYVPESVGTVKRWRETL